MTPPPYYLSRDGAHDLTPLVAPLPYYIGAAIKYLTRAGRKPGVPAADDLRKAAHCALLAVEHDPEGFTEGACGDALREVAAWCYPHDIARRLWVCVWCGLNAIAADTADELLRALDAGELP